MNTAIAYFTSPAQFGETLAWRSIDATKFFLCVCDGAVFFWVFLQFIEVSSWTRGWVWSQGTCFVFDLERLFRHDTV